MEDISIVIVDDSAFSVAFIRGILEENGFNVIGEAGSLKEAKGVVKEKKPTMVTMDMTIPGTDGLECTRAIHEIDPDIKVIMISSMMDEELVKAAKENRISAYIQKPVEADELITAIKRVMASEELYLFLEQEYAAVFKEALMDGLNRMTKTIPAYKDEYCCDQDHDSAGMCVIVGIIGKFSGRMLLDLSIESANKLSAAMLKRQPKNSEEMMGALGEMVNIVSGNACSILNRKNKALGLRISPPSVLHGDSVLISAPGFNTTTVIAETAFGSLYMNVGFQRGEE